ncbi:hypothetical protein N7522_004070 [Penicillium canescens]|nr:hypothetical protein N7522_004070 [Penicillium canescens]
MQVEAGLPSVEITDIIHRYSVDIITLLSVGQTSDSAVRPNLISMSINEVLEPAWAKLGTLFTWMFLPWLTVLMPPRARAKIKNSLDILRLYCTDIIRNSRSNSAVTNQEQAYLLSTALASKELSEDEIIDHMMTTMIAGSESSFNSIVRCCYLLCRDQALQARLRTEIRTHLPPIDRAPISPGKLASLPLLHGVCEETLRLHPAVPTTLRFATRDTSVQGKHIPKGTKIVVDFYALNRMTNTWGADSDAFVPERWLADESQEHRFFNRQGRPHLSFSWGNHNCIGVEVGRAEMRCAIAGLIGRFAMELVKPDLEFKEAGMIGMRSVDKIDIRITPIEGW